MPAGSCAVESVSNPAQCCGHKAAEGGIPEEIAIDAANRPHFADLGAQADDLDPHVGALLDDDVCVVGELRGRRAGVVLDFVGHELGGRAVSIFWFLTLLGHREEGDGHTWEEIKRRSGPAWAKKPWGLTVCVMASICRAC
jgi:hypothetical protein